MVLCANQPQQSMINDGVILEEYNKAVDLAIKAAIDLSFWRRHTPRCGFLGAQMWAIVAVGMVGGTCLGDVWRGPCRRPDLLPERMETGH